MESETCDRVLNNVKKRMDSEKILPVQIIEELKQNPTLFNTSIIEENNAYQYMFTYCDKDEFITFQTPVSVHKGELDTDDLKAFSCICAKTFKSEECVNEIYNRFKESIIIQLLDDGISVSVRGN